MGHADERKTADISGFSKGGLTGREQLEGRGSSVGRERGGMSGRSEYL